LREQRAAETRSAILGAARRLFMTKGWIGTGMRDVAAEAGVATETLYDHFSSKRVLLQAVVDIAERPRFTALGRGDHAERVRAAARLLAGTYVDRATLAKVAREAAAGDTEIAGMLRAEREGQRQDVAGALTMIIGREPTAGERDGIWALTSPEVYLLLVEDSGWNPARYETWMAETLERVIPRS
jgi:AcrR family transcriptional regulator